MSEGVESLTAEFEKKKNNLSMNLNIERSTKINSTRLQRMAVRNTCIEELRVHVREHLVNDIAKTTNEHYKKTMKDLIMQGLIKLLEEVVLLKCRQQDRDMVKGMMPGLEKEYTTYMKA